MARVEVVERYEVTHDATLAGGFENLALLGSASVAGTGNGGGNILTVNTGANLLQGLGGGEEQGLEQAPGVDGGGGRLARHRRRTMIGPKGATCRSSMAPERASSRPATRLAARDERRTTSSPGAGPARRGRKLIRSRQSRPVGPSWAAMRAPARWSWPDWWAESSPTRTAS